MEKTSSWRKLSGDQLEEWFLNHLPESAACFNQLLEVIAHFRAQLQNDKAEACADLLQETLKNNKAEEELLLLLERRAGWATDPAAYAASCMETLAALFQGRSLLQVYLAACGLPLGVQPAEALRRLRVLRKLQPGKCCYEKTWGLGTVAEIDEFDRQLVINFEGKPAHRFAFNYAAETVQPLEDDHLLALKLRAPEKFQQWVKDHPAETVRAILKQFGEMNLVRLRALMTGLVISGDDWSSFWTSARAKLALDPFIQMPAGRNEPIKILAEQKKFDDQWLADFSALCDGERILAETGSLFEHCSPENLAVDLKEAVADRLKFAVRGTGPAQPDLIVQAILLADKADIKPEVIFDVSRYGNPDFLLAALNAVPVRLIRPFLACLEQKSSRPLTGTLPVIIARLSSSALGETILYCRQGDKESQFCATLRAALFECTASPEMISWMANNLRLVAERQVCQPAELAAAALALLQSSLTAGRKKDASQLRAIFTNSAVLKEMLGAMSAEQRLDFSRRLAGLNGLAETEKNTLATKIILLFPDLTGAFSAPAAPARPPKLTSFRSYRARQAQLEKIINEEIPRNSKEIGVARSYGDLRENYEYKAAREAQGILMRRKADLEALLSEVRGTDFNDCRHDVAGPGNSVELKMPDGKKISYHILGELDSDEKLGIISCRSKLAEALNGHGAGDSVEIPGENSPLSCVIEAIHELPPEIKNWMND